MCTYTYVCVYVYVYVCISAKTNPAGHREKVCRNPRKGKVRFLYKRLNMADGKARINAKRDSRLFLYFSFVSFFFFFCRNFKTLRVHRPFVKGKQFLGNAHTCFLL